MCVLILSRTKENTLDAMGVDISREIIGDVSNAYFYQNNIGNDNIFPGGPSCNYLGEIPIFC